MKGTDQGVGSEAAYGLERKVREKLVKDGKVGTTLVENNRSY